MVTRLNIAIIGVGYWGKKMVHEYLQLAQKHSYVNLSMVCDLEDENLSYCEKNYNISKERLTNNCKDVLHSSEVDAIHICTPNETHYRICKDGLQAGKHVLLEKPMTLNAQQAYELVDIAESQDKILQVGHIFRFNNALEKIRGLIQKNYLGDICYLKLRWTTLMSPPPRRDIIFDLAPHPIDIINYLLGQWPITVTAKAKAYRRKRLEEVAYIIAELNDGRMAQIELSWLQPRKTREVTIIGSKRCATIDCLRQVIKIDDGNSDHSIYDLRVKRNNTIAAEITHFIKCIFYGSESINSGLTGAKNVKVLECVRKSLKQEKTMAVLI